MASSRYGVGWVYNLHTSPKSTDAGKIIAIACSFSTIALMSVVLRFAQRWKIVKAFGLDDLAAAASMLLGIGYSAIAIYQTRWGLGLDAAEFPPENAIPFSKVQYVGGPIYCLAILGFKVSLLASYLRVAGFNQTYRLVLNVAIALVTANQVIYALLLSFACHPIAKQWDPAIPGHCIDQVASYFGLGGSSLGFDLITILLPFPVLKQLQLNMRKKIVIAILIGLGLFVTVIQIIRIRTIALLKTYTDSKPIIIWSIVEINLGVFIACVPSFAPLLKYFSREISSYQTKNRSKRKTDNITHDLSSEVLSQTNTKKSKTFGTVVQEEEDTADDEVKLWTARRGWGEGVYGWTDVNAVPMTSLGGQTKGTDDDESDFQQGNSGRDEQHHDDIVVTREISVLRNIETGT
ncbi:hypothetical protein M433DRAFT_457922 [Acidomyces richmondensis BFW]|nr:MAG: hypothetical protein FE78DRAFT_252034 [Acidomyces sp. 'richmondensis']KYG47998.1 hypothetical protein M433DRAFT_457922 [Acidomyces richmondensis BFW]